MADIVLSPEQQAAFDALYDFYCNSDDAYFVLHGLAGSGKTTVLSRFADLIEDSLLCSLTGKAASILRRKTGLEAMTIHSAFYHLIEEKMDKKGRRVLIFEDKLEEYAMKKSIVLIDECSMINEKIAQDIFKTGAKIIACGDPGQLPPIEGQQFFSKADMMLTQIHRQAMESPIIRQAHAVRNGKFYEADGENFRVARPGELTPLDKLSADVVLCWTNGTRKAINRHIRDLKGFAMTPYPQAGEPVICLRNVPDMGIFNGGIYTLAEPFMEGDRAIRIDVDGVVKYIDGVTFEGIKSALHHTEKAVTWFDFGYALTVHKAQGSEWDNVILIDEYRRQEHRKEWLYTGITRAAQKITIIR